MSNTAVATIELDQIESIRDRPGTRLDTSFKDGDQMSIHDRPRSSVGGSGHVEERYIAKSRAVLVVMQLTLTIMINSVSTGLVTSSITHIARDLSIPPQTYYWPLSVFGLTCGSCLLVAGAVADVVGSKVVFLTGNFLLSIFIMACGISQSAIQLIMFRAMQGIAAALAFPTSVAILTNTVAPGRWRNIGFGCLGLCQVLGYSIGLVFGGVFLETIGWRAGFYIFSAACFSLLILGAFSIPKDQLPQPLTWHVMKTKVDWVGAGIASTCLALLAYVLVELSVSQSFIKDPAVISLLAISVMLMPTFAWWMNFAAKRGRAVLIPNRVWKKLPFTMICIIALLSYATLQVMELFCTLFFQNVQRLSPLQTSIRLLPSLVVGGVLNVTTGFFIDRASPRHLVLISSLLAAGAPLLMAVMNPRWPYWYAAFPGQILAPASADVLFCVGLIVVSEVFSDDTQALAGAVFNTVTQFGASIGLALVGVVSDSATQKSRYVDKTSPDALEVGYKAGFWTAFAWMMATCVLAVAGLRNIGKVGLKRD